MKFYVSRSFTTRNPQTGKIISGVAGQKISQSTFDKLSSSLIKRCGIIPARNAPRNGDFTPAECDFLVTQYVQGVTPVDIVGNFYQQFPGHKVNGGVECQLRIIAGVDNTTIAHIISRTVAILSSTSLGKYSVVVSPTTATRSSR